MKKLFTLCLLFCLIMTGAKAQVRKSWDFRKWSDATIANLASNNTQYAGAQWRDYEKDGATPPTTPYAYWSGPRTAGPLTVNVDGTDIVIPETQYLSFGATGKRKLVISFNQGTAMGDYAGSSYFWINGKSEKVTLPNVKRGETIKMGIESHKLTEARGVDLLIDGTKLAPTEGNAVPTTYNDVTWTVPSGDTDSTSSVVIQTTNGCHIYYITIGSGDQPQVVEEPSIAYLYDSSYAGYNADSDPIKAVLSEKKTTIIDIKDFNVDGNKLLNADSLMKFDLVVVGNAIDAKFNAFVPSLKKLVRHVPMINFNASFYDTWGYGKLVNPATATGMMTVANEMKTSPLLSGVNMEENGNVTMNASAFTGNYMQSFSADPDSYFSKDSIYSTVDGVNAIHRHGTNRNAYLLIPISFEGITGNNMSENAINLFNNAITIIEKTKAKVLKAAAPVSTITYGDRTTSVKLNSATTDAKIYYTTDGTDPTISSNLYTEPLIFTDSLQLKAFTTSDGFYDSEIQNYGKIAIKIQTTAPTCSTDEQDGYTMMTLNNTEEGASLYYNLSGSTDTIASAKYTEPVKFTKHGDVTYFAAKTGKLNSIGQMVRIAVKGEVLRTDTLANLTFQESAWGSSYVFGSKAYAYWTTTKVDSTLITGKDTTYYKFTYLPKDSLNEKTTIEGWKIGTYGQVINIQSLSPGYNIGDVNGYNYSTIFDTGASKNALSFLQTSSSSDPASGYLQSTSTYKGPFDVNIWVGNQVKDTLFACVEVLVSKDGTTWIPAASNDTIGTSEYRLIHKGTVSYEGTDNVYLKIKCANHEKSNSQKVLLFNVLICGNTASGIEGVKEDNGSVINTQYFNIGGSRLNKAVRGINIVKKIYSDGTSKTSKIIVR